MSVASSTSGSIVDLEHPFESPLELLVAGIAVYVPSFESSDRAVPSFNGGWFVRPEQ